MCLCADAFKTAHARGLLAAAIDAATRPCPTSYCVSSMQTAWLNQFALSFTMNRELRRDGARKQQVYRWYIAAGEEIPDAVERFWRPGGEVGEASFCVVRRGTTQGSVCLLKAHEDGKGELRLDGDENFRQAIEWARGFVVQRLGSSAAAERVRRASVETDKPGERFEDGSVAFAALVAFFSLAARLPVLPERVFTGVPAESGRDVAPPAGSTLRFKLQAVKQLGEQARLVAPPGSDKDIPALDANAWLLVCNWRGALQEALGKKEFELIEDELNRGSHLASVRQDPATSVLRDAVQACLLAAGEEGLSLYELELCFDRLCQHYPGLNNFSTSIRAEMQRLQLIDAVSERDGRWRWLAAREEPSPLLQERTLSTLAEMFERQGEQAKALRYRLFLRQFEQVGSALEQLLSARSDGGKRLAREFSPLLGALLSSPTLAPELFETLERSNVLPSALLQVAVLCAHLPAPFSRLTGVWARCEGPLDRLLWLQSVTETTLHLLWLIEARSLQDEAPSKQLSGLLAEHVRRPSLGVLCKLLAARQNTKDKNGQEPARNVLDSQGSADSFASSWNELLHRPNAWETLDTIGQGELERRTNELAEGTIFLLERLRVLGGPEEAKRTPDGCTGEVSPELLLEPDGVWLFRRGTLGEHVRYWALDQLRWDRAHGQGAGAPRTSFPPPDIAALPGLTACKLPLDYLPTPVAKAILSLRRGLPPPRQLACVDEVVRWLFSLALPHQHTAREACRRAGWPVLRHKRSMLDTIQADTSSTAWLGAYMRVGQGHRFATELVGLLERLEHAPAPVAAWEPWLAWAAALLGGLLAASPWVEQKFDLFKQSQEGPVRFLGLVPRAAKVPAVAGVSPGLVWLLAEDQQVVFSRELP